jgi:hypothetical protein
MRKLIWSDSIGSRMAVSDRARPQPAGYGRWVALGLLVVAPCYTWAQQTSPAKQDAPRPADLEPGVNTSATSPSAAVAPPPAAPAAQPKPAASGKSAATPPKTDTSPPTRPAPSTAATGAASKEGPQTGGKSGGKAEDHLQLDTTQITGNQELPKVLYIVPWKRSDLGDLLGKPPNSLIDEVLEPVDRDVFKRENRYYDALKPDAGAAADKSAGATDQAAGDKR